MNSCHSQHMQRMLKRFKLDRLRPRISNRATARTTANCQTNSTTEPKPDQPTQTKFEDDDAQVLAGVPLKDYEYEALPSSTSIRLLSLLPAATRESTLHCTLLICNLTDNPSYDALSYLWGVTESRFPLYHVQPGKLTTALSLAKNCSDALRDLRRTDEVRMVWVDAICINQNDIAERNSQVAQMARIYESAHQVVAYLGPAQYPAHQGRNYEAETFKKIEDALYTMIYSTLEPDEVPAFARPFLESKTDPHTGELEVEHIIKRNPWFERCWTMQEIGLAKDAVLLWGSAELSWTFFYAHVPRLAHRRYHPWRQVTVGGRRSSNGTTDFDFKVFVQSAELFRCFRHDVLDQLPQSDLPRTPSFLDVLVTNRYRSAKDPRDFIYAFLGHPTANSLIEAYPEHVLPDYAKATSRAFHDFAVAYLCHTKDLRILSAVEHFESADTTKDEDCSWVPTWNKSRLHRWFGFSEIFNASGDSHIASKIELQENTLDVSGFILDTVQQHTVTLDRNDVSLFNSCPNGPVLRLISPLVFDSMAQSKYDNAALAASVTLVAGWRNGRPVDEALAGHLSNFCTWSSRDYPDLTEPLQEMLAEVPPEKLHGEGAVATLLIDAAEACHLRRFFVTENGWLGLGPATLVAGDRVVVLCGARVPFVLRPCKGGRYRFVGEAYVHGAMQGEAISTSPNVDTWISIC